MDKKNYIKTISLPSGQNLTTRAGFYLAMAVTGQVTIAGAGMTPIGVLYKPVDINQPAPVAIMGVTEIVTAIATPAGTRVSSDNYGRAQADPAGSDVMLTATKGTNQFGKVLLNAYS